MAQERTLTIERRNRTGTSSAHALRVAGKIPGVLYGHGSQPLHLALEARAFSEVLHHGGLHGVITLVLDASHRETAMVREIQRHPVTNKINHVDLQRVTAHEAVHAKLGVVAAGVAMGVREFGGVLDVVLHEIEVEGPIDELPDHLEIDVTGLGIHQHILAGEIKLPKNLKLLTPPDTIVISVEPSKTARLIEEAAASPVEAPQPEIIGKPEIPE